MAVAWRGDAPPIPDIILILLRRKAHKRYSQISPKTPYPRQIATSLRTPLVSMSLPAPWAMTAPRSITT